jgi:hypothetical protein
VTFAVTPAGSLRRLPGDRTRRELHPWTVVGRLLTCTVCGAHVDLVEIPEPWIDERSYVCGPCLQPVEAAAAVSAQNRDGIPY